MAKLIEIMQVIRDQVVEEKDEITATQFVADNLTNAMLGEKISGLQNLWDSLNLFSRPWFIVFRSSRKLHLQQKPS